MQTGNQSDVISHPYSGTELEIFQTAVNWKNTLRRHIQPWLSGDVLEVGAGIGGTTRALRTGLEKSWTCLEPDGKLAETINTLNLPISVAIGTLESLDPAQLFDTIIYIDVLEHIEDDRREIELATGHLKPGGRLIVLSPAHQFLYSAFDAAIGHFRRYNKKTLRKLCLPELGEERLYYLDSVGLLASAANRLWLSQSVPSLRQITFWDQVLVRLSRMADPLMAYSVGKSVLGVWQKMEHRHE